MLAVAERGYTRARVVKTRYMCAIKHLLTGAFRDVADRIFSRAAARRRRAMNSRIP